MKAIDYIMGLGCVLPMSTERPCTIASRSEVKRWLRKRAVLLDGIAVDVNDKVEFPVGMIVFFPKAKTKTTMPGLKKEFVRLR